MFMQSEAQFHAEEDYGYDEERAYVSNQGGQDVIGDRSNLLLHLWNSLSCALCMAEIEVYFAIGMRSRDDCDEGRPMQGTLHRHECPRRGLLEWYAHAKPWRMRRAGYTFC